MDPDLLKLLGWSPELIDAANRVATGLPDRESSPAEAAAVQFDFGGTVTADEVDLSSEPPVGTTDLRLDGKGP